ncbi:MULTISPECIES: AbrB family transcriptional regulator [Providencia]|uniref:AbrB family transcriptional regulator n=1 Tax=Providencia TaxID=586 RepID=UPI00141A59B1|nr:MULTISPECIES: AbrB family transcriptional regulator [Providencia]EIU7557638.1 AbrB family transcriptional regulator [Providencia rettgeri]EJD6082215.1 AbrB family transcriptional regulator [Providencia rettgeri]EJD6399266.1 AbrB family transcriptional regulator [Providencia rettgeri]EJD6500843.1 AbrB family transcriptional regulator [Providencia rettgeri]EJD6583379.1 AbrB family transcriptional regulator [Providencia rettgeri]
MMKLLKMIGGIAICSLIGGGLTYLGIPLALMFGPIIAVIIFHRFGVSFAVPKHTITFVQVTLGTSVGLMFNQVSLNEADNLFLLLLMLVVCLAVQFSFSFFWFYRKVGWTKQEAMLGSVPGAMAAILALTDHTHTPPQKIVISHTIRLIILILLAGIVVGSDGDPQPIIELPVLTLTSTLWLLVIIAVGLGAGLILQRLRVPAPFMLTSLAAATLIQSFLDTPLSFPLMLTELSMVLIGMNIGNHFIVFPLSSLIKNIYSSAQVVIINIALTFLITVFASWVTGYDISVLLLAWAPGSMEAMTFAAITMNLDAGFVMSNHIIRMVIIQSIPSIALFWQEKKAKRQG